MDLLEHKLGLMVNNLEIDHLHAPVRGYRVKQVILETLVEDSKLVSIRVTNHLHHFGPMEKIQAHLESFHFPHLVTKLIHRQEWLHRPMESFLESYWMTAIQLHQRTCQLPNQLLLE